MNNVMSESERINFLSSIGLKADGDALGGQPAKVVHAAVPPVHQATPIEAVLAPPGVDPRLMAVDEIEFDARLLDRFPSLEGDGLRAASDYVFSLYKSYTKDKVRNPALHRKITTFITTTRRNRQTGGMVTEQVKTTKRDRDVAALIAASGVSDADLAEALRLLAASRTTEA